MLAEYMPLTNYIVEFIYKTFAAFMYLPTSCTQVQTLIIRMSLLPHFWHVNLFQHPRSSCRFDPQWVHALNILTRSALYPDAFYQIHHLDLHNFNAIRGPGHKHISCFLFTFDPLKCETDPTSSISSRDLSLRDLVSSVVGE